MAEYTAKLGMKVSADGAADAIGDLNQVTTAARNAEGASSGLAGATGRATGAFKLQKGATQQLGYQVQDLAVQLQSGTSFMTAFGQQGSQMAGVFGPGGAVLGAIIAVSSAIGGVFIKSMMGGKSALDEFESEIKELRGSFDELSQAQARYLAIQVQEEIKSVAAELRDANYQLQQTQEFRGWQTDKITKQSAEVEFLRERLTDLRGELENLNTVGAGGDVADPGQIARLKSEAFEKHAEIMRGINSEQEMADNAEAERVRQLAALRGQAFERHSQIMQEQADKAAELRDLQTEGWKMHYDLLEQNRQRDLRSEEQAARARVSVERDVQGAFGDLMQSQSKELFELGKAGSIANAIMSTYEAANKALAQGGIFGVGAAAVIAAAGFANVQRIASTKYGGGSSGGSASIPTESQLTPQQPAAAPQISNVAISLQGDTFSRDSVLNLIESINDAVADGAVVRLV